MIYSISPELNRRVAEALLEAIGDRNYFSGTVDIETEEGVACRLVTSCVVYRRRTLCPDGDGETIVSVIPVWWEFHTACPAGVLDNDFSFRDLGLETCC